VESSEKDQLDAFRSTDACVIGYGKVGRSIAQSLRAHAQRVTVFGNNPVRRVQALAHGFRTTASRTDAIHKAGLVLCTTGNLALRRGDFEGPTGSVGMRAWDRPGL
jgi:adenosylhomocysteinase